MWRIVVVIILVILAFFVGYFVAWNKCDKKRSKAKSLSDKHLALFLMMNEWTRCKIKGKKFEDFFKKRGYKRIAIYGMSYAGETLVKELENSDVEIAYGIEQNADNVYASIELVKPNDELKEVDCIVVTPITAYDAISAKLEQKISCPILCLEDILYEL